MNKEEAKKLAGGEKVEIRYQGVSIRKVIPGRIYHVYAPHTDGSVVAVQEDLSGNIQWDIPSDIVYFCILDENDRIQARQAHIQKIAKDAAEKDVKSCIIRNRQRENPLNVYCLAAGIAYQIEQALYKNGYPYYTLDSLSEEVIACNALYAAGYYL